MTASFIWRNIGGALVRMPLVRQAIGHEEADNRADIHALEFDDVEIINPADVLADPPMTKKRRRVLRSRPTDVDTLAIHQMDAVFGTSRQQRKKYGGRFEALIARMCLQPYHTAGLVSGPVVRVHGTNIYTYASSGANRFSHAVGLEGKWPRFERNRKAHHTEPSDQIHATYTQAIRTAYEDATAWGCKIRYVTPHCAWSKKRKPDPGEWIWKYCVIPMMEELGLMLHPQCAEGGVFPPEEWER